MQIGVNVLSLSAEEHTQLSFAKAMIIALQKQQPGWQFIVFARQKQSVFFKNLAVEIISPPALLHGQWLLKQWLKKNLQSQTPVLHLLYISPKVLVATPQRQWVILFDKATEKQALFFGQQNIQPIAVWPHAQVDITPKLQPEMPICGTGVSATYFALDWHQRLAVKDEFTEGAEYFFYDAKGVSLKTMVKVLKAFSLFKKRQKTGMKLVINSDNDKLQATLTHYKFRADVVTELPIKAHPQLVSAAYAVIFTQEKNTPLLPLVQALTAEKALICWPEMICEPIVGEAALYAKSLEPDALAAPLMQLYTNEQKAMALQQHARLKTAHYNWQQVATVVAAALVKA